MLMTNYISHDNERGKTDICIYAPGHEIKAVKTANERLTLYRGTPEEKTVDVFEIYLFYFDDETEVRLTYETAGERDEVLKKIRTAIYGEDTNQVQGLPGYRP